MIMGLAGWLVIKNISTNIADHKAESIIENAYKDEPPENDNEKIIAITREVFEGFTQMDPGKVPLLRLRSYVTNRRLPEFLRLPTGVIETNIQKGLCDNASRMLAFTLDREGFKSVQWNMVTDKAGHSALLVTMPDGEKILADPFYGVVTKDEHKKLINPLKAKEIVLSGKPLEHVFVPLTKKSNLSFYKGIANMSMASEGEDMILEAILPKIENTPLFLGEINGEDRDVQIDAAKYNMTPYWNYLGHKYNREWVRVLKAEQPVRLVITLVEEAEKGVITSDKEPEVSGKTLTWHLKNRESLTFRDGLSKISFKRLNSYIGVDQIAIYPDK